MQYATLRLELAKTALMGLAASGVVWSEQEDGVVPMLALTESGDVVWQCPRKGMPASIARRAWELADAMVDELQRRERAEVSHG